MDDYNIKLEENIFPIIKNIKNPNILELGVQNGTSTNKFLDLCEKNSGHLFSVDVVDCSKVSNNKRWKFIQSRDDNFDYIKSLIPKKIDVIYIDTLHEAAHVKKIIYGYYEMLNEGGFIFIDDISHLPYLKTTMGNNFYCEINNKETFEIILEIYETNKDLMDLNFSFKSSGVAIIKKKKNLPIKNNQKIKSRERSIKNIIRLIWKILKKN